MRVIIKPFSYLWFSMQLPACNIAFRGRQMSTDLMRFTRCSPPMRVVAGGAESTGKIAYFLKEVNYFGKYKALGGTSEPVVGIAV